MAAVQREETGQVVNATVAEGYEKKCIFCKIVNKEIDTDLLHCDEEISCFRDIKPGAPHHYLVVPTKHVGNCKSLRKEHVPLVEKMVEMGKEILQKNNVTDLSDVRFGFHWPPFCSVSHLHLHVLAPASEMGFVSRLFYRINSYWFTTYYDHLTEVRPTRDLKKEGEEGRQPPKFIQFMSADQLIQLLNSKGDAV